VTDEACPAPAGRAFCGRCLTLVNVSCSGLCEGTRAGYYRTRHGPTGYVFLQDPHAGGAGFCLVTTRSARTQPCALTQYKGIRRAVPSASANAGQWRPSRPAWDVR
jgi:hypothetical protein